jgi:hypothetical protein
MVCGRRNVRETLGKQSQVLPVLRVCSSLTVRIAYLLCPSSLPPSLLPPPFVLVPCEGRPAARSANSNRHLLSTNSERQLRLRASPHRFCPEAESTSSLIMQLKSFSWAEQIFTAYFAVNCFAWRRALPFRQTHTLTHPITKGLAAGLVCGDPGCVGRAPTPTPPGRRLKQRHW